MAEANVYRVKFEYRVNRGEWLENSLTILAGDAEAAIAKCRKAESSQSWTDEGKKYRTTGWRLLAVDRLVEVDLP